MNPRLKQLLVAASPLIGFALAAFGLSALLGLRGADAWILRGGMLVLGAASSGVTFWFMHSMRRSGGGAPASPASAESEIDATFGAARAQLASSRAAGKATLTTLPTILVLGPSGSAKTTSVVRSGLDAELLAGGGVSGETVAPTTGVNLWFARDALVLEAGGALLARAEGWKRVLHHVQPSRISALFRGRAQAPRAAVVCIGCDRLLEAGGAEAAMSAARLLRERLGELSRTLGTRLPVYVVFTKLDRVPFFADWVRGFTKDEASGVLGATLPGDLAAPVGSYTDRETARLNVSFDRLVRSLSARRTDVLGREYVAEHRAAAYEFPREFRKLAKPVIDVLVEIGRPSQLQVSPFLRGFFFTGVQAVLVSDAAPARAQSAPARAASVGAQGIGATNVFEQPARAAVPLQSPALTPSAAGVRKVPRWVFLDRLLPEVVLGDTSALDITRGGAGVDQVRRLGLAAAAALGLVLTLGLIVSFIGNRRLENRTVAESRAVAALPAAQLDLPSAEQLGRLDSLRARLETLAAWERDGAPLRLRFGLYRGSGLIAPAGRVWFDGFERVMFADTRRALAYGVRALPEARATDDYGARYDLLKAYLVTSAHPDQSVPSFLTPVLMRHWLAGRELDADRNELARRQFDHYGAALPIARPFADSADTAAVRRAREQLLQSAGSEPIYRSMIADASSRHTAIQYNTIAPGSATVVANMYEVPGAFTREGWAAMQASLANIDRFYQGEPWVLGEAPNLPSDRARLVAELRARYTGEYVRQWRAFLAAGSVPRFNDLRDAARRLSETSTNRSPLLGMLALAARHTAVDSAVAAAFQPVHLVTPPTLEGSYLADGNRPYVDALISLQSAVNQTAMSVAGMEDQAAAQATSAAATARVAARTLAQGFAPGGDPAVGSSVLRLLEDPIARVEPLLRSAGTGELNVRGQRFCASVRPLMARQPFASRASARASVDDVTAFFRPGSGELWRFYDEALSRVVERQGGRLVAKPGGTVSVAPGIVDFFDRALAFSNAFFRDGSSEMRMQFELMPLTTDAVPMVAITLDGVEVASGFNALRRRMLWTARTAHEARLEATLGGTRTTLLSFEGPWALFQLFQAADTFTRDGEDHRAEWTFRGRGPQGENVTIAANVAIGDAPVLRRDYFAGFTCSGEIVR